MPTIHSRNTAKSIACSAGALGDERVTLSRLEKQAMRDHSDLRGREGGD